SMRSPAKAPTRSAASSAARSAPRAATACCSRPETKRRAMRIWITRAEPGASRTAGRVRALGHEPVVAPLLEVHALTCAVDPDRVAARALPSANGVRAFAERCAERPLPVFTVGDATAAAARKAGFTGVASASGDLDALADLIAAGAGRLKGTVLTP